MEMPSTDKDVASESPKIQKSLHSQVELENLDNKSINL